MKPWITRWTAICLLMLSAGSAYSAVTVFTSQTAFVAATQSSGIDTFDELSGFPDNPFSGAAGPFAYEAAALLGSAPDVFLGLSSTSGPAGSWLSVDNLAATMTFRSFAGAVNGAGGNFFPTAFDGSVTSGTIRVSATFASGTFTETLVSPNAFTFIGFLSDNEPLLSLTVSAAGAPAPLSWPTADNLILGSLSPVDEPSAFLSLVMGMVTLAMAHRVRRRDAKPIR